MSVSFLSPLRLLAFLFFTLLVHDAAFADAPYYYLIHGRLVMKDGRTEEVYFQQVSDAPLVMRDEKGFYYYSIAPPKVMRLHSMDSVAFGWRPAAIDHHYGNAILPILRDNESFYRDASLIRIGEAPGHGPSQIAVPIGPAIQFSKDQVRSVTVESIHPIFTITHTRFTPEDRSWLASQVVFQKYLAGYEICSFEAAAFQKPGPVAQALLSDLEKVIAELRKDLSQEAGGYQKRVDRQNAIIEKLRLHQIIVYRYCSC